MTDADVGTDPAKMDRRRTAMRKLYGPTSILGGTFGGADSGNSVGVGEDASGNGNAGSSASGW